MPTRTAGLSVYSDREPFARHDVDASKGFPGIPYVDCSLDTLSKATDDRLKAQWEHVTGLLLRQAREQPDVSEHSERVGQLAESIMLMMGGTPDQGRAMNDAGRVHDVGKLYAPASLMYKKGDLTPPERTIMERHARDGAMMLMKVPGDFTTFLGSVALLHHRNMDGTGYPKYQGDHFPPPARIIAAADRWDALRSPRPYKQAYSVEKSLETLTDQWTSNSKSQILDNRILAALTYIVTLDHYDLLNAEARAGCGRGAFRWFRAAFRHEQTMDYPFGAAKPARQVRAYTC